MQIVLLRRRKEKMYWDQSMIPTSLTVYKKKIVLQFIKWPSKFLLKIMMIKMAATNNISRLKTF
jgi:hypothetical protein